MRTCGGAGPSARLPALRRGSRPRPGEPLLLHLCCTAVAPLLHRCCTSVAPLLHLCCTAVSPLLHQCRTTCVAAAPLLCCCCTPVASLLHFVSPLLHRCCIPNQRRRLRSGVDLLIASSTKARKFALTIPHDNPIFRCAAYIAPHPTPPTANSARIPPGREQWGL